MVAQCSELHQVANFLRWPMRSSEGRALNEPMLKPEPAAISSAEFFNRSRARLDFHVPPGLVDHVLGWIEPDDPRTQFGCQHLRKAPGATAKVDDQRDSGPVDMGR